MCVIKLTDAHILIVEDDELTARALRSVLRGAGYGSVEIATTLGEARLAIEQKAPGLALVDIGLGEESGLALGKELAERRVPVLYVSGRSDEATIERASETRPTGFVVKPFTNSQLLASVRMALTPRSRESRRVIDRMVEVLLEEGVLGANVRAEADVRSVPELAKLTSREWEVLRGLVAHQRVPTIARRLNIQASTVRNHLKSIYAKLDVHSQQELLERVVGVPDAAAG